MKKCIPKISLFTLAGLSILVHAYAQVPQGINYQAIARDASGKVLDNQSVNVKVTILDGSATGTILYEETHQDTTDAFGLFTLTIGQGNSLPGAFDAIDWGSGAKFLQVSMDPEGEDNFIEMGTTQLLSVPYALYAEKSGDTTPPPTFHAGKGIAIANDSLTNTGDTDASDDLTVTSEAEGDVRGKFSALKVEKLQGTKLQMPDSIGKDAVLKWDGTQWKPGTDSTVWNNNDSLIFYPEGNVGIGIEEPEALLHINRLVAQDDTFIQPMFKLTTTDTASATMGGSGASGLNMGLSGNQAFITSNQSGTFSIGSDAKEAGSLALMSGGENHVTILPDGKVGIGLNTPNHLHHVHALNKNISDSYESFSQYTNEQTGTEANDGLIVGMRSNNARIENRETGGLEITTGGALYLNSTRSFGPHGITIEQNGNVGILVSPATHELHLRHASTGGGGATAGLKIENEGSNNNWWAFYTTNNTGELELYYKGSIRGEFDPADGEYRQRSDGRLKRSIAIMSPALEKILQLKPSTYFFIDDENPTTRSLGFIAQEVQPLFPELVGYAGEEQDIMTLNYNGFSVLAIKAIQEQQALIKALTEEVATLKKELTTLKNK